MDDADSNYATVEEALRDAQRWANVFRAPWYVYPDPHKPGYFGTDAAEMGDTVFVAVAHPNSVIEDRDPGDEG